MVFASRDLDCKIVLLLLDLGLLALHHIDEELLFEAGESDGEVDDAKLDARLWQVVWVCELRGDE